jgi:ACS family glucarate transporter-like MFS transporter
VMNTGNQAAGAATAVVTPWIAVHFGWTTSFLAAAALCVVGSLAWLAVDPERKIAGPLGYGRGSESGSEPGPEGTL